MYAANIFFNPGVERKGLMRIPNEFFNPRVRRYGVWKAVSQILRPEPPRSGFMQVVTAFLDAPVYRLQQGGDIIRPRQRNANFLQRFISGINEFLNAYTHFADLFARPAILEVPSDAFKEGLDKLVIGSRLRIERLTQRLMEGKITPREYEARMLKEVRRINLAAALLGVRGLGNVTPGAITAIVGRIASEQIRLMNFLRDSFGPNLTQPLNIAKVSEKQFRAFANRYASAGRAASTVAQAELMKDMYGAGIVIGGTIYHRRVVRGDDNSCESCLEYGGVGWVRMDGGIVLPPPGVDCECQQNCRCLLEYCLAYMEGDCPDDYG